MLSKLFSSRQSTASRVPPSQPGPTSDQPTDPKPPSKLATKLKEFKNALRLSRLTKKADNQAGKKSKGKHRPNPSDESWGNLAPGPFTPKDYEFRYGFPIHTPEDVEAGLPSTEGPSGTVALSTTRSASPESDFPTKPPSTQFAPTFTTLANASSLHRQSVSISQVEAEVRKGGRHQPQEVPATRARHAHIPVPPTASITQRYTPEVAADQAVEQHLLSDAKICAKTGKKHIEKPNKWWEMGGNRKRHFRRDAVDYGNPNGDYCNVEEFGEKSRSLKRGGAIKRRQRLEQEHSSKQAQASKKASENEPILGQKKMERAPSSTTTDAFKCHGRKANQSFTGATEAPNQPAGGLQSRVPSPQASLSTVRQPLRSLDTNTVLSGEAQALLQAGSVEDSSSEDDDTSQETGVQGLTPEASFSLGGIVFPRRQNPGPAQL